MAQSKEPVVGRITRRRALAAVGAVGTIAVAGCTGGADGGEGLSGPIDASGSNTVAPITSWAGENFQDAYPDVLVDVDPQGTGAGFQEFCRANSDIQSASRLITRKADRGEGRTVSLDTGTLDADDLESQSRRPRRGIGRRRHPDARKTLPGRRQDGADRPLRGRSRRTSVGGRGGGRGR
ncbi:substrate-binding domain-containing protein [Halalkaliarchaeum desulfuricum]|uniref:substrate-binding domain-containing protein n=1 Tax=Halalkaliarchaeum desulfuricum TaxID=2055893 RepID=UPI001C3113E8|nr:substrate-binding domain-containing protein [Halalkaliarchaeum desulfuricum]